MAGDQSSDEIEFGSDSFLDVVANIVGILIILIVIAGAKAGTAPVSQQSIAEYARTHQAAAPPVAAAPVAPPPAAPAGPIVIQPSPDVLRRAEAVKAEWAALDSAGKMSVLSIDKSIRREEDLIGQIAEIKKAVESDAAEAKTNEQRMADAQSQLKYAKTGLIQMEVDVQKIDKDRPPPKTIEHKLTPLSMDVQGKEVHYRLHNNKVAYLPVEELLDRLRPQMHRQREWLIRSGSRRGDVGPVSGFRMEYLIEVRRLSIVDELRQGGSMTIGISEWHLVPEPDLESETADKALKEGSEFLRTLRAADPDSTVTFWVYPDSFPIYRRLQEFAHQENLTVATRPLPFGVPIGGSPQGTRSSGQ